MASTAEPVTIDRETLSVPVRAALGRDTAEIIDWQRTTLHGGVSPTTGGVYRVMGRADDHGETLVWSLVLKVLRAAGGDTDPTGTTYWKREVLAYQSGVLTALAAGVIAPRCFGISEFADESAWLWLEEVTDTCGAPWPFSCYGTAAYHLGQFNGAYWGEHMLPAAPWLSRGWLAAWVAQFRVEAAALARVLEHPLVRQVCPGPLAARLLQLLADHATFLAALDRLPQTFCHHDAWSRNLFLRRDQAGHEQTVLIDWADAGSGALGQELAAFIWAPVLSVDLGVAALPALEDLAWSRYLDGLRDVGWTGDPAAVRLGYTADMALRGVHAAWACATVLPDVSMHLRAEVRMGRPIAELVAALAGLLPFLLDRADEARSLLRTV